MAPGQLGQGSPVANGPAAGPDPYASQRGALIDAGLLVPSGVDGLYGRGRSFEAVVTGLEAMIVAAGADQHAALVRYPPVEPRAVFERSGYLRSFPDLAGAICSFDGNDRDHAGLLADLDAGRDWTRALGPTDAVLCSAACHPLYPSLTGVLPAGGVRYDVYGWVFRHEPSLDPARMQAFRQYEYVYVGEAGEAVAHRDLWRDRAVDLLSGLGLDLTVEVANDPFFGRVGRLLKASQQEAALKYEVLARTSDADHLTAITSANCHEAHFGEAFAITAAGGTPAHSACVGFGVERITLALLWAHGVDPDAWPSRVRARLWP